MPNGVAHVRSAGPFEGWLRGAAIQSKYHGEWSRLSGLGRLVAGAADSLPPFDTFTPVPLHPSRLRHRGFNQSLLLARGAGELLSIPVEDMLVRTRRTDPQVHLGASERLTNVQGAMEIRSGISIAGRSIVLVDDVITTGSTLAACAEILHRGGASTVHAVTLCREM